MRLDADSGELTGLRTPIPDRSLSFGALSQVPCGILIRSLFDKDNSLFVTNEFPVRARRELYM
jgi:hypothetical protein